MVVLICVGFAAHGVEKSAEPGKMHLLDAKKALMESSENSGHLKTLFFNGNQLSVPRNSEDYSWDEELNDWQHVSNTNYTYNNAGKLIEEISRDAETNYYLTRNTYSYGSGNTFEEVSYVWIIDGWRPVNGDRRVNTFFETLLMGAVEQTLENEIWINKNRIQYIYGNNTIPTGIQTYHWNGTEWMIYSKIINLTWADWPNRELAAYTIQYSQDGNWVNAERYSKQYDGDNYTTTTEVWENEAWVNSTRETYTLTGTEEELILESWTPQGWKNTEKYQGTFDDNGNPTGMKYSSWFDTGWELELVLFMDLTYSGSIDVTELVIRSWNPSLTNPENLSKYVFSNFLHLTTDVPEISNLQNVKVFPNPVSSSFTIQIDENRAANYQVNIVNIAGQTVFSNTYSEPFISVNAGNFTPGIYLLNIKSDEGNTFTSKLLKK